MSAAGRWSARYAAVLCAGLGGCLSLSLDDLDDLNRSLDVESILIRERFTLYSPFDSDRSKEWSEMVETELGWVSELLDHEDFEPISVLLEPAAEWEPLEVVGDGNLRVYARPRGLLGWAVGETIVVRVAPPPPSGEPSGPFGSPEAYRETVRHELTHAFVRSLGLEGARWYNEGVAEFVEALAIGDDGLELAPAAREFAGLGELPPEERRLVDLLNWSEEDPEALVQPPSRALAQSFVHYTLERLPRGRWVEGLEWLSRSSASELLAREASWHAWLGSFGQTP